MSAFANVTDLETRLGRSFTGDEADLAEMLLEQASDLIRAEARQQIDAASESVKLQGNWTSELRLPQRPVTSVTSVTLLGTTLVADVDWYWPGVGDILLRGPAPATGAIQDPCRDGWHWGGPRASVVVDNDHGYSPIPADLITLCLDIAGNVFRNPEGAESTSLGSFSESWGSGGVMPTVGLTPDQRRRARRYRRGVYPQ